MNGNNLLNCVSKPLKIYSNGCFLSAVRTIQTSANSECSPQPISREVEEVKIPVPWGHIAAKWWGPKNKRPILMAHGWQDNCGTFNTLIPHLCNNIGYLAFDFPGHGLSSHFPLGTHFLRPADNISLYRRIAKYFNWDSLSLIGHSMGAITGFSYAAMFPQNVDLFVSLDALRPPQLAPDITLSLLSDEIEKYFKIEDQIMSGKDKPLSTYNELFKKIRSGSSQSIDEDKCYHILERNATKSSKHHDKFYFSRDGRLRFWLCMPIPIDVNTEMAKQVKCATLAIKSLSSLKEQGNFYDVDFLKKHNPLFKYVEVPGTHHVHLNEPEKIANIINKYLRQYAQHLAN